MMENSRGITSRRSVLGIAGAAAGGLIFAPGAIAYAGTTLEPETGIVVEPEPHHDVTQLKPEQVIAPRNGVHATGPCGTPVTSHNEINGFITPYENPQNNPAPRSFNYHEPFYNRVETWFSFWRQNTPIAWGPPFQIWCWGVTVDKNNGCKSNSYHNFGRAFDISRIYATNPDTGVLSQVFNARYDVWGDLPRSQQTTLRRQYWATAASLHYHFNFTLTLAFNTAHHNHIHFDNGASGSGNSTFSTGSSSQVGYFQQCANDVWGQSLTVDRLWGPKSSAAASAILARIGRSGALTSQANWLEFNKATTRFGSGAQTF